jgi:Uma2 family endonuclease
MSMPAEKSRRYTIEEYLEREHIALQKHEWRDGEIFAMGGGSIRHSLIIANLIRSVGNKLEGKPCRVYDSNLRVGIPHAYLYTYPDISVICGQPENDAKDSWKETVTNPKLLIEVVSPTSDLYDRTDKFRRFRMLESLREYVIVWQKEAVIETFFLQDDRTWALATGTGVTENVRFRSIDVELALAEVYAGVEFDPPPPALTQLI